MDIFRTPLSPTPPSTPRFYRRLRGRTCASRQLERKKRVYYHLWGNLYVLFMGNYNFWCKSDHILGVNSDFGAIYIPK